MRGRLLVVRVVFTVLVATGVVFPIAAGAQGGTGGVNVALDIQCTADNGVQFSLTPWNAKLYQGDSIAWVLSPNAQVPEITITSKQTAWPFLSGPPYTGNAAKGPKAKGMKPNQAGKRFAYAVTAVCTRADATKDTVIIDPDVIIIR